jgi:hypothetical protein
MGMEEGFLEPVPSGYQGMMHFIACQVLTWDSEVMGAKGRGCDPATMNPQHVHNTTAQEAPVIRMRKNQ